MYFQLFIMVSSAIVCSILAEKFSTLVLRNCLLPRFDRLIDEQLELIENMSVNVGWVVAITTATAVFATGFSPFAVLIATFLSFQTVLVITALVELWSIIRKHLG